MPKKPFRIFLLSGLMLASGVFLSQAAADFPFASPSSPSSPVVPMATRPAPPAAAAPKPLTDDGVLDFFHTYEPKVYEQIVLVKDKDKAKYDALMKDFTKEVTRLLDLKSRNEALFNLTMEDRRIGFSTLEIARNIREGNLSAPDAEKAGKELESQLSRQFDVRQKIRQATLDEQKARIEDLKKRLEDIQKGYDALLSQFSIRGKSKEELIKQRVADLMKKNPKVEW